MKRQPKAKAPIVRETHYRGRNADEALCCARDVYTTIFRRDVTCEPCLAELAKK